MPSAGTGTENSLVPPASPQAAKDAADATPGQVDSTAANPSAAASGSGSSTTVKPFKPDAATDPSDTTDKSGWVEVVLTDEAGTPAAGEPYEVTLPDGSLASGTLDENGMARVEGFAPGPCHVSFPNRDQEAWDPA
jgi:type VI secretion system secreted protein VgrG